MSWGMLTLRLIVMRLAYSLMGSCAWEAGYHEGGEALALMAIAVGFYWLALWIEKREYWRD